MRYIALVIAVALLIGCDRDPYIARKGGYTPGETYRHQNGLYPGMVVSQAGT